LCEHGTEKPAEVLLLDEERFKESARYVYTLKNQIQQAREYTKRAINMNG